MNPKKDLPKALKLFSVQCTIWPHIIKLSKNQQETQNISYSLIFNLRNLKHQPDSVQACLWGIFNVKLSLTDVFPGTDVQRIENHKNLQCSKHLKILQKLHFFIPNNKCFLEESISSAPHIPCLAKGAYCIFVNRQLLRSTSIPAQDTAAIKIR